MSNENKTPTITLITSWSKHEVVLKEWVTVGDFNEIKAVFKKAATGAKIDAKNNTAEVIGNDARLMIEAEEEAQKLSFSMTVISIDGETEDLYNKVKTLRNQDGMEIFEKIEQILSPKKPEESVKAS